VAAQNPVEFGPEPLDRSTALEVEKVGAEFDCNAAEVIERTGGRTAS
jgi:hypothetical protein